MSNLATSNAEQVEQVEQVGSPEKKIKNPTVDGDTQRNWHWNLVLTILVLLIILCIWNYAPGPWNYLDSMGNLDLATRLKAAGWVLYTNRGCRWCAKQLAEFSEQERKNLATIECDADAQQCAGIGGYPTWYNTKTNERKPGYKSRNALRSMLRQRA